MTADHLANITQFDADLWKMADDLRANSGLASNEYFMPIMGLLFLRQASNRYAEALAAIEADQAANKMPKRPLTGADFTRRRAMWLPDAARYDEILRQPKDGQLGAALTAAMEAVEECFPPLAGQLPKNYETFDDALLEGMMRKFDSEALRSASGDVFGRLYEYFLAEFSKQGAHDNGEFFTPPALVQTIVNVIEPDHGIVLDPACGSGGMFVQSSHFIEHAGQDTMARVTFYGHEKNETTAKLARINLAVHGLEGQIEAGNEAITYYKDPHGLVGQCDFVMANPPFNVDEVDAEKVRTDQRLPFGLPGENKNNKVPNANYLWLQYFYSYLNETGRAGVVMSSQASSAGRDEAKVRQELVETGAVDVMIDIRGNFFYTRTVPCQLWFVDRAKERDPERADWVLMLDARNIYRQVSRAICDFSPEQQKNIAAIVWLYRGQSERFLDLVETYLDDAIAKGQAALTPLAAFADGLVTLIERITPVAIAEPTPDAPTQELIASLAEPWSELAAARDTLTADQTSFAAEIARRAQDWQDASDGQGRDSDRLHADRRELHQIVQRGRDLSNRIDLTAKLAGQVADAVIADLDARKAKLQDDAPADKTPKTRKTADPARAERNKARKVLETARTEINKARRILDTLRAEAVEALRAIRYVVKQADWLQERFPDAVLRDVEGLVKRVSRAEIKEHDWSLTPGRYVGIAPEAVDEDFDFEEALRAIHTELNGLNEEAVELAARIARNFAGLGV